VASYFAMKLAFEEKIWGPFRFIIDRPAGFVKEWPQPDGSVKRYKYPVSYGYFKGHTDPGDGEGLDAFVGDDPTGSIESFLKMKRDDDGELVPDETKFMVGLSDSQRDKVLGLYSPEEVTDLREYGDFYELVAVLEDFRDEDKKMPNDKQAAKPTPTQKPATAAQISYAKVLLDQGVKGLKGIPGWLDKKDVPTDAELAAMDMGSVGELIDALKSKKPFTVEGFGNGSYRIHKKAVVEDTSVQRVVSRHLEDTDPLAAITMEVEALESLWSDVQAILDMFSEVVPTSVGRLAGPLGQIHSQTQCYSKCVHAIRHCGMVINMARTYLQVHPGEPTASTALRDAQMLYERFTNVLSASLEMQSTISQKVMPTALKAAVETVLYGLRAVMSDPNLATVIVRPRFASFNLNGKMVEGMVFDAFITVFPDPKDTEAGMPKFQQFVLTQATMDDTAVYLQPVDRTNEATAMKSMKVKDGDVALKKVLGLLAGWSKLNS